METIDEVDNGSAAVMLDGAMATELARRGFELRAPAYAARALDDAPELLTAIYLDYLRAGAQVLTTDSFGLYAPSLREAGQEGRQAELAGLCVAVIEAARDELRVAGEASLCGFRIAGSVPPTGAEPEADAGLEESAYRSLGQALVRAGVDLILLETYPSVTQAGRALRAVSGLGVPVWLSVVAGFPTEDGTLDGSRMSGGERFTELFEALLDIRDRSGEAGEAGEAGNVSEAPGALLINCTQIDAVPAAVEALAAARAQSAWPGVLGLYPHLGGPGDEGVWIDRILEPEVFADRVAACVRRWPQFVLLGGCCGVGPAEIAALSARFHGREGARERGLDRLVALVP